MHPRWNSSDAIISHRSPGVAYPKERSEIACIPDRPSATLHAHQAGRCSIAQNARRSVHSHSIVLGGFELTSYTTRFTPRTVLVTRVDIRSSTS